MAKNLEFQEILGKVGLNTQESKTYLALLQLQEAQTGALCKETGIASSNIYNILDSLIQKGLVSYRIQNNIKIFMPSNPEALNELFLDKQKKIEEERKQIQELVRRLKIKKITQEPQSNYKYYEGISGVKGMWQDINASMIEKGEERIYGTKKEAYEKLLGFYDEHHKIRNKLKKHAKILSPKEDLENIKKKRSNKNTEVKATTLTNEAEWGIVDDMVYIQYIITKNPRGFLIKDKIFAETFKEVFDKIWNK